MAQPHSKEDEVGKSLLSTNNLIATYNHLKIETFEQTNNNVVTQTLNVTNYENSNNNQNNDTNNYFQNQNQTRNHLQNNSQNNQNTQQIMDID